MVDKKVKKTRGRPKKVKAPVVDKKVVDKISDEDVVDSTETPEMVGDNVVEPDETGNPEIDENEPVSDEDAQATVDADEDAKELKSEPKNEKSDEADVWYKTRGMRLIRAGHGQRNIIIRAGTAAGLTVSDAINRFKDSSGTFEERLKSLFD